MRLNSAIEQNSIVRQKLIEPIEFTNIPRQHYLTLLHRLKIKRRIVQECLSMAGFDPRQSRDETSQHARFAERAS
jgi:hypothetical protein